MLYGGIDAHKTYLTVAIVDKNGEVLHEVGRVPAGDGEALLDALEGRRPLEVVVEACSFWPWIADTLAPTEVGFHLAHAKELEAIAHSETKTDSVDARLLARMLAAGLIPEVYPKPPSQREICRLIRHRDVLTAERTRLANRMHSHLHQQGLRLGKGRLLTDKGRRWLREEAWPWLEAEQRALVKTHLELIDTLTPRIEALDGRIEERAEEHPAAQVLQTIPGIGSYRSLTLVGEITPIERFPSATELVSFVGLAPVNRHSGGTVRHGGLSEDGNRRAKGALESAVLDHRRHAPESSLSEFYDRKVKALGKAVGQTAAARKLCRIVYAMLHTGEVWRG